MATRTADIHIRIEPALKMQAEQVFSRDGYSMTDAFVNFCRQSVYRDRTIAAPRRKRGLVNADKLSARELDDMVDTAVASIDANGTTPVGEFRKELSAEYA